MEQVGSIVAQMADKSTRRNRVPTVSATPAHDVRLEMVHDPVRELTAFALFRNGDWEQVSEFELPDGRMLVPFSPHNNLIEHGVVKFAFRPQVYESEQTLIHAIQSFIHRYVDVSPRFERITISYVLLTWLFDNFNDLPYLRVRGEPGSGKTRFLLTVGSICYKPIFASGASTVSPIFRILDAIRGTLVIDESDFRVSDERAEVVKILNNGNVRGFPVLRTEIVPGSKEFDPRAYHVFGPKIIASRGIFEDTALESRFLTEHMESGRLRTDIPISLPPEFETEALELRNQLLLYRFRHMGKTQQLQDFTDRTLEPRLAQVFAPLIAVTNDPETRADLIALARGYHKEMILDRGIGMEADLLESCVQVWHQNPGSASIKDILASLVDRNRSEYEHLTPKRVGWMIRKRLGLSTMKSEGTYILEPTQGSRLKTLCERYGVDFVPPQAATLSL